MCKGLPERLRYEMDSMCPKANMVKISASPDRLYSVWLGGSILPSINEFRWISRADYEDEGFELIHSRL